MSKPIIFINSHPIQYFAPLYKAMTNANMDIEVWYCSDESIKGGLDKEFGQQVKWDIPLLEGYRYRFFKNYARKPSIHHGFLGLLNVEMLPAIWKQPKSMVVVHGWSYAIYILVVIIAKIAGHQVALRGESPLNQELLKSKKSLFFKRLLLQYFLFRFVDKFLYIGQQNKAFYQYYGVKEEQLVFTPYAVDNERFQQAARDLLPRKRELRSVLGLPTDAKIILFSGKYIEKKRPMDLLQAYAMLAHINDKALVMVGEGELRPEMEKFIAENKLENVFLTGFINQSEIVKYYAIADVFVMCSGTGETWGLSTNEAMNFGLPIILSDVVGCASDFILNKEYVGIIVPLNKPMRFINALTEILYSKYNEFKNNNNIQIINNYDYNQSIMNIKSVVNI